MYYVAHYYYEKPHMVVGTMVNKHDISFLVTAQPPMIVKTVDHNDHNKEGIIVVTNNYDDRVYPKS